MNSSVLIGIMILYLSLYTIYILKRYPSVLSYSNSWYLENTDEKWLFLAWCSALAFPMAILTNPSLLGMLSAFGLLMVAVSAPYKDKIIGKFHYVGVALSVITSQIYFYNNLGIWYNITSLLSTVLIYLFSGKKKMLWAELTQFISAITGLILIK